MKRVKHGKPCDCIEQHASYSADGYVDFLQLHVTENFRQILSIFKDTEKR